MRHLRLLFLTALLFFAEQVMLASAGFPLLKGAMSKNGDFVVSVIYEYEDATPSGKRLKSVTYHVDRRERFINYTFKTSNAYWSGSVGWDVTLTSQQALHRGIAVPVISDDGKAMALLKVDNAFSKETEAIRIYRQDNFSTQLVGVYRLRDIWSREELEQQLVTVAHDSTPPWFEGSGFEFSALSDEFIVHTKTGRTVHIELEEGKVLPDKP